MLEKVCILDLKMALLAFSLLTLTAGHHAWHILLCMSMLWGPFGCGSRTVTEALKRWTLANTVLGFSIWWFLMTFNFVFWHIIEFHEFLDCEVEVTSKPFWSMLKNEILIRWLLLFIVSDRILFHNVHTGILKKTTTYWNMTIRQINLMGFF